MIAPSLPVLPSRQEAYRRGTWILQEWGFRVKEGRKIGLRHRNGDFRAEAVRLERAEQTMDVEVSAAPDLLSHDPPARLQPCPPWLSWWLESTLADWIAGTSATLDNIGLRPGQRVLEIGPGPGRLLIPAARRVLPGGSVTGLELQPSMADRLRRRAAQAGVTNLGEIADRAAALAQSQAVLKPGGVLAITEIRPDPHYLPLPTVQAWAEAAGFRLGAVHRGLGRYTANFVRT